MLLLFVWQACNLHTNKKVELNNANIDNCAVVCCPSSIFSFGVLHKLGLQHFFSEQQFFEVDD